MSHGLLLGGIEASALQNYIDVQLAPRQVSSILFLVDGDFLAVYCNCTLLIVSGNLMVPLAVSCVMLQQISQHGRCGQIVDCNNLITFGDKHLSESKTPDTSKTVNRNSYICHVSIYDLLYVAKKL